MHSSMMRTARLLTVYRSGYGGGRGGGVSAYRGGLPMGGLPAP